MECWQINADENSKSILLRVHKSLPIYKAHDIY
jgi:hypothetical protein